MLLSALVDLVDRVRATPRRTEKIARIAAAQRETSGRDVELLVLYLTGTLPQGRIGLGWRGIQAALEDAGPPVAAGEPLTLADLDARFEALASLEGPGSAARRREILREIFARAAGQERRFLAALMLGEVRQGALDGLVQDAIASATGLPVERVRRAAMFADSLGKVARAALEEGAAGLGGFAMRLLAPMSPMLASPAEGVDEALERLGECAFEYKVDGARVQVHRQGDAVRVFTRQLQDVTERVPEIVEWARGLPAREVVLEGEALVLRPDARPQPFQVTMRRLGRSKDVAEARRELPLSFFFFDCLYVEGQGPLLDASYRQRMDRLAALVPPGVLLPRLVTSHVEEAEAFMRQSLAAGHEGLMAKALEAPYVAGQRGFHWLKIKPAPTLDLVVLAAERGSGRREGWLSNLHLGARDPERGGFVMLGKTFKGLTDAMLRWQTEKLLSLESSREAYVVRVRPELVVEIAFGEIQESARYPGGLALRFARVKRYREDKGAHEADTIQTVRDLFERRRR